MISKGSAPTAAQKRWWDWLGDHGCCISLATPEIHHIKGAKQKLKINGVTTNVGNENVIPLSYWHHRDPKNPCCVDLWKKRFEKEHGTQKELLAKMYHKYIDEMGQPPFDTEIFKALMND